MAAAVEREDRPAPVIRVDHVWKQYALYERPADRLIELFLPDKRHRTFDALADISFEIEKGETVGIIGRNGAGKSTLLKLLAGVTAATKGTVKVEGSVASILELGTGFHPDFTGRSNAALNAAILGLNAAEVRERLPLIFEFSELGSFLDQPVKTYSSGMFMRLAFAVAVNVNPDVLIVDEALAVGDGHFQRKCLDRIREFQELGRTILFCSHAVATVASLCQRAIWLDGGRVVKSGHSADVVRAYESSLVQQDLDLQAGQPALPVDDRPSPIRITAVRVDAGGPPVTGAPMTIELDIDSTIPEAPVHVLVGVDRALDGAQCFTFATYADGLDPFARESHYTVRIRIDSLPIGGGDYTLYLFLGDDQALHIYDRREIPFSVEGPTLTSLFAPPAHAWRVEA